MKGRLIVVSNRVADPRQSSAGGLAVAVGDALTRHGGIWFGWSGKVIETMAPGETKLHQQQVDNVELVTLDLSQEDYQKYYLGFSNRALWPVLHYRLDLADFDSSYFEGYQRVNRMFASRLLPMLKPDDVIWIHDYHLIPLAAELRRLGSQHQIGFFLHVPVPPRLILAAIPGHSWLMRSLFAYDLIGLQSEDDTMHVLRYLTKEGGAAQHSDGTLEGFGRAVRVQTFPIGIDVDEFKRLGQMADARSMYETLKQQYPERKLLLGVDRLDYSKGIPQRFKTFRLLLKRYPENQQRTTMVQIAPRSRENVKAYADLRRELEGLAGSINADYGEIDWHPLRYIQRSIPRRKLPGFYRAGQVALVTPLRDGMNLVAKEFVAAQDPNDPGVLVLSRFAGAAAQLKEALLVNPYDIEACADATQRALQMPLHERQQRHIALLERIREHDVHRWARDFLKVLADS